MRKFRYVYRNAYGRWRNARALAWRRSICRIGFQDLFEDARSAEGAWPLALSFFLKRISRSRLPH